MTFDDILDQVIALLKRQGRVSYRALKMRFEEIDDEYLDVLKEEILFAYPVTDEDSRGLVWRGETGSPQPDAQREVDKESRFHALLLAAIALLQRDRRVTYRTLKHIFGLEDVLLDEIREELTLRRLAIDEQSKVLVWTGETQSMMPSVADVPSPSVTTAVTSVSTPLPVTEPSRPSNGPTVPEETISTDVPQDDSAIPSEPTRTAPEAERRQLTVMFCDLADSTQLSQKLDPEDLREVMRAYQQTSAEVIQRFDGYIAQHLGDGLLIYFGWPRAHEDDAQRALHAGLGVVEAITTTLNPCLKAEKGVQLTVRLGVHTGPVVVGEMGGAGRHENLATGETVNLAARLESLAPPNTVVISNMTERLVRGGFVLDDLGSHELKGVAEPMQIFRVLRPMEGYRDEDESLPDGGIFLVGRDEEIGLLLRRWQQSKEGLGQVVLISGEAGIGKSSLVATMRTRVAQEGSTRITFRCSPYHTNSALYPVITHLEQMLGFDRDDTSNTKLDKLEQALKTTSLSQEESVPLLATLLSVPLEDRYPTLTMSPQQQRQQTLDTLVGWLMEESEKQPVLAVWEDLHWADPSTLEMLDLVLEQSPTVPMLNVLIFRPEFTPPWPTRSHMTPITLNRLERPQVEALITHLTGGKTSPVDVVEHIVAKTDGVPLYVEELTKMLLASELLQIEADQYVLTGPLSTVAIPDTLQDFLMARLDQLNQAKEVAQLGAVLGREFTYELVQAIASKDDETLQASLAQLVEAELVYQRGRPPRARYIFRHALIQDAAYASLLRSARQQVHQQIAQVIEKQFPETVETQPEILAHHNTEAGLHERALVYWRRAGTYASERSAYREAVACFEQALEALQHLPANPDRSRQAIDLRFDLRGALVPLGAFDRILDLLHEAETLATALDDSPRLGRISVSMAQYFAYLGNYEQLIASSQRSLAFADASGDIGLQVTANVYLGCAYHCLGDYEQALASIRQNVAILEGNVAYDRLGTHAFPAVPSWSWTAWFLSEQGAFAEAMTWSEDGIRIAESVDYPYSLAMAYAAAGLVSLRQGALQQASLFLERGLHACQATNLPLLFPRVASALGLAYTRSGRFAKGLPLLEQAVEQSATMRFVFLHTLWIIHLSEGYRLACRMDDAAHLALRALDLTQTYKEQGHEARARHLLGDIYAHDNPLDIVQAETSYQHALTLATELGMRPLQAHCHRGLGTLYGQTGQVEQARVELATAIEMYRDMEMTFWLPETETALAEAEGR